MNYPEILRQYGAPLTNFMFAGGFAQKAPLARFNEDETKRTALEKIAAMPLLHDRIAYTRLYRCLRLKQKIGLEDIRDDELDTAWPHGPALPPPTADDPFSMYSHLPELRSDEERVMHELRLGFDDLLATIEMDKDSGFDCDLLMKKYKDLETVTRTEPWREEYQANRHSRLAILSSYADQMMKARAFFELDQDFVGLDFLKDRLWNMHKSKQFAESFASPGGESDGAMHMAFVAERGMGKSTIAEKLGPAMKRLGLLEHGRVVTLSLTTLAESTLGAVESNIRRAFGEAQGGILFFDEVDTVSGHLSKGQSRSSISQAINEFAEKQRENTCLIVATYPSCINTFLDSDEGLRSRFGNRILHFPDYTTAQLVEMYDLRMKKIGFHLEDNRARSKVWEFLSDVRQNEHKFFASGRTVRELAQATHAVLAERLEKSGELLSERYNSLSELKDESMVIRARDVDRALGHFRLQDKPQKLDVFNERNPYKDNGERQSSTAETSVVTFHDFRQP